MSTLRPSCLPSDSPEGAEAVAFYGIVVDLFKVSTVAASFANNVNNIDIYNEQTLPTYDWLAQAGITPDSSTTYTLSELTSALKSASGVTPALDCNGKSINQISWYFNLKGSLVDGRFVPIGKSFIIYSFWY